MRPVIKCLSIAAVLFCSNIACSQKKTIWGETANPKKNDTISFVNGLMGIKYYEQPVLESEVVGGKFKINAYLPYPQMYFLSWKSQKADVLFHASPFFLDDSASKITAGESSCETDSRSFLEFQKEFVPYMLDGTGFTDISDYMFGDGSGFDLKLARYTSQKPDSYVALWLLIRRFNENGYCSLYGEMLNRFSKKVKSERLWMVLNGEFKSIAIKEGGKFPELALRDSDLKLGILRIPKAQYTLIDFWFSRCRPCLEQLPLLKEIYADYNSKGFNIVGISTDKTANVEIWKKRIAEKEIPWQNYLDENAVIAAREKIFSYPTNFLLDKNGRILKKNIDPQELQKFLTENLKK
ncbi:MAG: TlpA disulfide reductase family protein [Flavobacterium nitrogenifigens]|uniref:TlpA family protein disulfide reductase n=1 Tax=Flavobacterium nitrogenifigens TaxID=1617283 RepID=UPI0028098CBB|nr:TlpA disulfide reductase family protein [Flavobacterium nitrogenifigens]MDQ8013217.1 TlpA disulfide reductase family protein [Flavobacterium nitrogenifigens]